MNIESGIPIPPPRRGQGKRPPSGFTALVRTLEVGQSLLFDSVSKSDHARKVMTKMGWAYARRKSRDGWRVWRIA